MNTTNDLGVYCVVTEKDGAPIPRKNGVEIKETQYTVLASSVAEAVAIVEESNKNHGDLIEPVTKAWYLASITEGLAGTKYEIVPLTARTRNKE